MINEIVGVCKLRLRPKVSFSSTLKTVEILFVFDM